MTRQRTTALKPEALGGQKSREHELANELLLQSSTIEAIFDATSVVVMPHQLGRRYSGGFVVSVVPNSLLLAQPAVQVVTPDYAEVFGYDPSVDVVLIASDTATGTYTLRVF